MADEFRKSTSKIKGSKVTYKHLLERHRRARINNSLNELKHLILSSLHHDDPETYADRVSERMEKADILDLTVEFLKENKQAATNGIQVERTTNEHVNERGIYPHHMTAAMPVYFPYRYYGYFSRHPAIPSYLGSPSLSDPLSPVQLPSNQIDGNQQLKNALENGSISTEKEK